MSAIYFVTLDFFLATNGMTALVSQSATLIQAEISQEVFKGLPLNCDIHDPQRLTLLPYHSCEHNITGTSCRNVFKLGT